MSTRVSKAALARHKAERGVQSGPEADAAETDLRVAGLRDLVPDLPDERTMAVINSVFGHTDLVRDRGKLSYIASLRASVGAEWQRAGKAFLRIGRLLLEAERKLSKTEYDSLIEGSGRLLPFGRTVAVQLRRVAQAVDSRRLPEDRCPSAYSVAYSLVTLPDEHLRLAEERNLIRPDVRREEVKAFRAELSRQTDPTAHTRVDLRDLRKKYEILRDQRRDLLQRALAARQRMREIAALLDRRPRPALLTGQQGGADENAGSVDRSTE
jgi:hypothetical protein